MAKDKFTIESISKLPRPPKDFLSWCADTTTFNYLFFSKKEGYVKCSRCGAKIVYDTIDEKPVHGKHGICPVCGIEGQYRAAHYGRKNLTDYINVVLVTRVGDAVVLRYYYVDIDFEQGTPSADIFLRAVYYFGKTEQHYYIQNFAYFLEADRWKKMKSFSSPPIPHIYYINPKRIGIYVYNEKDELDKIFAKTHLRHNLVSEYYSFLYAFEIQVEELGRELANKESCENFNCKYVQAYSHALYDLTIFLRYLESASKNQSIELMEKVGLKEFILEGLDVKNFSTTVKMDATDIRGVFRGNLNITEIHQLATGNFTPKGLRLYLHMKKQGIPISLEMAEDFHCEYSLRGNARAYDLGIFTDLANATGMNIAQIMNYLMKSKTKKLSRLTSGDYHNYIEECFALGLDVDNKHVIKPRNLRRAHEETSASLRDIRTAEKDAELEAGFINAIKNASFLGDDEVYVLADMFIRPAQKPSELVSEGSSLNHCVGGDCYISRMAKGESLIFFIRKIYEPDKSFYTLELELKDARMRQLRGKHNCSPTEEVQNFVDIWMKEVVNKPKRKPRAVKKKIDEPVMAAVAV